MNNLSLLRDGVKVFTSTDEIKRSQIIKIQDLVQPAQEMICLMCLMQIAIYRAGHTAKL